MTDLHTSHEWSKSTKIVATALIAALAGAAYYVGSTGLVAVDASQPFRPIAFTVIVPVALFFTAYALSSRLRTFVLAQDLRTLTMLQHWRVLGFSFLLLYAHDALPAAFAWPAGFGDILIGFTAPFVVARTDLLCSAPGETIAPFAKGLGLRILDPPFEAPSFDLHLAWHERNEGDGGHMWLRDTLLELFRASRPEELG